MRTRRPPKGSPSPGTGGAAWRRPAVWMAQTISNAGDRLDEGRVPGVVAQLMPESRHRLVHHVAPRQVARPPDGVQQLVAGERPPRLAGHEEQERELRACEGKLAFASAGPPALGAQREPVGYHQPAR